MPKSGLPGTAGSIDLKKLGLDHYPNIALTRFLNVDYVHAKTGDGGDIYVTRHGLPFIGHMEPENWYTPTWFKAHREKLAGTSTVYKVTTKPVGRANRSTWSSSGAAWGRMCRWKQKSSRTCCGPNSTAPSRNSPWWRNCAPTAMARAT